MNASGSNNEQVSKLVIDDLMLSAWLDEELDPVEARQVQSAVDAQPELQQRLARLLVNERRLREHYTGMAESRPMPEAMRVLLANDEAPSKPWFLRLTDWTIRSLPRPALITTALALALVVGLQIGSQTQQAPAGLNSLQSLTQIGADHPWFELLESSPSGELQPLSDAQTGQVALTYRDLDGHWCRQFSVQSPGEGSAMAAVACREAGRWRIGLAQSVPVRQQSDGYFRAASAGAVAIDSHIMESIAGDVLMPADEKEMIDLGWQ